MFQGLFTKKFLDDVETTISCFMNSYKISNNFFMDKIYIQGITKYNIDCMFGQMVECSFTN